MHTDGENAVKALLMRGTNEEFPLQQLITLLVIYFPFTCWTSSASISSGLVIPMLYDTPDRFKNFLNIVL